MTSAAFSSSPPIEQMWPQDGRATLRRVGIVGLGETGATIVELCVRAGLETLAVELSSAVARHVRDDLERNLYWSDESRAVGVRHRPPLGSLALSDDLGDLADCDLVIDCTGGPAATKRELIADLDAILRGDTLIATHTGRLSVTELAALADRPERVVGLHLPHQTAGPRLVEVVGGELTDPEAVDQVADFVRRVGGHPLPCRDSPGLVVERVLVPLLNDCVRVLDETGVTPEALDAGLRASAGWSLGPCALLDDIGIDVQVAAAESLYAAHREPRMAPPPRLVRMRRAGLLGRKTGRGFYSY